MLKICDSFRKYLLMIYSGYILSILLKYSTLKRDFDQKQTNLRNKPKIYICIVYIFSVVYKNAFNV